eukprot:tig00000114_g6025.t1
MSRPEQYKSAGLLGRIGLDYDPSGTVRGVVQYLSHPPGPASSAAAGGSGGIHIDDPEVVREHLEHECGPARPGPRAPVNIVFAALAACLAPHAWMTPLAKVPFPPPQPQEGAPL